MPIIEDILARQLELDVFHSEDAKVSGIAQRAVDQGYSTLSTLQQKVLEPFLSQPCVGLEDPGGYHNECKEVLEGQALLDAYDACDDSECLQCESCREQADYYADEWARYSRD